MMARRVRRFAVVVIVLVVAGTIALVLTTRPELDDSREDVDRTWTPLRAPLADRYGRLAEVNARMAEAGAGDRDVARVLGLTLARWDRLRRTPNGDADAEAEAETAARLEGLATRVQAVVSSSDRLRAVDALLQAIAVYQGTANEQLLAAIKSYNDAAQEYEDTRNGLLRRPVAGVFGYESRPQLLLSG